MNYRNAYEQIISARVAEPAVGVVERHHIVPRCLGGSDSKENIVKLTPKEHFVCHHLLARIYGGSLWAAYFLMSHPNANSARGVLITARQYQSARAKFIAYMSTLKGDKNGHYGKKHSEEARQKISKTKHKYSYKNHPRAINENLEWEHKDGDVFFGSHFSLSELTKIDYAGLRRVANGKLFSYKGWMCISAKRENLRSGLNANTADKKEYKWISPDGQEFIGTRYFARKELGLDQGGVSNLVRGTIKKHKGWSVCH